MSDYATFCIRCKKHTNTLVLTDLSQWALCAECVAELRVPSSLPSQETYDGD